MELSVFGVAGTQERKYSDISGRRLQEKALFPACRIRNMRETENGLSSVQGKDSAKRELSLGESGRFGMSPLCEEVCSEAFDGALFGMFDGGRGRSRGCRAMAVLGRRAGRRRLAGKRSRRQGKHGGSGSALSGERKADPQHVSGLPIPACRQGRKAGLCD